MNNTEDEINIQYCQDCGKKIRFCEDCSQERRKKKEERRN